MSEDKQTFFAVAGKGGSVWGLGLCEQASKNDAVINVTFDRKNTVSDGGCWWEKLESEGYTVAPVHLARVGEEVVVPLAVMEEITAEFEDSIEGWDEGEKIKDIVADVKNAISKLKEAME